MLPEIRRKTLKKLTLGIRDECGLAALCAAHKKWNDKASGLAAVRVYDDYTKIGLQEKIPFLGVGTQYIRFAREEPELYRLLFLTQTQEFSAMQAMRHLQALVRPTLIAVYHITADDADLYFRNLWLVVHSLSTLIVTGDCPYRDQEIGQILTGFSLSTCKAIKEIPGFAAGTYDRDAVFRALVSRDAAGF